MARKLLERDVERYLVKSVRELGGQVRKVQWVGMKNAPDRLVMLPRYGRTGRYSTVTSIFVELKNPETIRTFPANAHERAQKREHERMRELGQIVAVIGNHEQVEDLLK